MTDFTKFPKDAPKRLVLAAMKRLGFEIVRTANHIGLKRLNDDGTITPMTLPNHRHYKGSTLRSICNQAHISREAFLSAYYELDT